MEYVVFDFDGPIFDGRKAAAEAIDNTIKNFEGKFPRPSLQNSALPLFGPKRLISLLYPGLELADREPVCTFYRQQLHEIERRLEVTNEVRSALDALRSAGFELAIYSMRNLDELDALLKAFGLRQNFCSLGCSPQFSKPSGDYFRFLSEKQNTSLTNLLYIGDSDWDFTAADDAKVPYYHAVWTGEPTTIVTRKDVIQLSSLSALVTLLTTSYEFTNAGMDEIRELHEAVELNHASFYGGAGISERSGFGGWEEQYRPVLDRLSASYLEDDAQLPEAVQLLAANPTRAKRVFDAFSDSFKQDKIPNAYHFAMLRSNVQHLWTSNYDNLFEQAIVTGHFGASGWETVRSDKDLLNKFRAERVVIKMNGDFDDASFNENLDWGLVFLQEQFDRAERDRPEIWRLFEDDYRQRCIVFVGVSFRDPVLKRIVSVARQKISRTRYNHYLITKREKDKAGRLRQSMFAENLRRSSIITVFKESNEEIADFVQCISRKGHRPVIGFSGDVGRVNDEAGAMDLVMPGMAMTAGDIGSVCSNLGRELARREIRVTSGCAPFVGKPAVEAAFKYNPSLARFYLRLGGGTTYKSTAPAIVVPTNDYASMRERFIPELSALIAIGGRPNSKGESGTLSEIDLALANRIPVVLLSPARGDVGEYYDRLCSRFDGVYQDKVLAGTVASLNAEIKEVSPDKLVAFAEEQLPGKLEKLLNVLMGASIPLRRNALEYPW